MVVRKGADMNYNQRLYKEVGDFPPVEPLPQDDEKPKRRFSPRFANPINIPISLSASYFFDSTKDVVDYHEGRVRRARYGRYDNPTIEYAECMLSFLDECERALLFPSGMSAISTTLLSILSIGDHIVFTSNCYRNILRFCEEMLPEYGIESTGVSSLEEDLMAKVQDAIKENTKVVFLETPSNPHMCMVNIEAVREAIGSRSDVLVVVDSTFATPHNFKPVRYGADLVIHSCTKYLSGHADIMAGSVAGKKEVIEAIRQHRNVLGNISDGFSAYMLVRSLMSLGPRMEYYNAAGQKMAEFLESHPRIKRVYYLGLPSHPHHDYAESRMKGYGGVVSFELDAEKDQVSLFVDSLSIPYMSTNFGAPYTLIEQYSVFTLYTLSEEERERIGISDQLVRMSLGFEDLDRLIDDLGKTLAKI